MTWRTPGTTALAIALALLAPGTLSAQTIRGQVLDAVNEAPVGGVIVRLVGRDGAERLRTLSDSIGRFVVTPPSEGEYLLSTERFGYLETRSPLLALTTDGEASLQLMVSPEPLGLEGLEISVEELAAEELSIMGLSPNELGARWIDREKIDAIPIKRDVGVILEHHAPAGMQILRSENTTMGSDDIGLCIAQERARQMGRGRCSLIVLDGVPISGVQAKGINPDAIESIAVLRPIEAITQYGTLGGAGAVLVWTRRGG